MRRSLFNRNLLITKEYNYETVNDNLSSFENVIVDNNLITKYKNIVLSNVEVSNIYYNFDFSDFSKNLLNEIVKYFKPERYSLKMSGGTQELKLVGGELFIDGERYEKMISILNSTDKSKALSMNIGLIKTNSNKKILLYTILTNVNNKHYKSSLPDKIKTFSDNLKHFNINIDYHIKTIEDLKNYNISIIDLYKKLSFNDKGEFIKTSELKVNALFKNLKYNIKNYNYYNILNNLSPETMNNLEDFKLNAKIIHDCYMKIFKDKDTSIISRESRRIIEAIDYLK